MQWLRRLRAIPELIVAYGILRADVEAALADPQVRAVIERFRRDPVISLLFPRLSAEWRAVEEAVNRLR